MLEKPWKHGPKAFPSLRLGLYDFAAFNARRADPDALGRRTDLRFYRSQIYIPTATRHIVCMGNVIAELWTLLTNCTNLRHGLLQIALNFPAVATVGRTT